jgi:HSP20 family protein
MNIVSYQPWRLLNRVQRELDQAWAPSVDVREDDAQYTLQADLPGVDAKDIQVTADEGVLTIRGDRQIEKREDAAGYRHLERQSGSFLRRFTLPENAKAEEIKAKHVNGVLEVVIPKQAVTEPRKINVAIN